jgi:predicted Rossmann fold nucleotide-binding protein DprA/Smf involved in DNA uptake
MKNQTTSQPQMMQSADSRFPTELRRCLGADAPRAVQAIGNLDILRNRKLAVFCSVKCPGSLILKTYDLMRNLRETGVTVIGGFHSPIERECLHTLLRGKQPIIICPARSLEGMRVKSEYKSHVETSRLLFLSGLAEKRRRVVRGTSVFRNRFVAALADTIVVTYAQERGKTEELVRLALSWEKAVFTLADPANSGLIALGAKPILPSDGENFR